MPTSNPTRTLQTLLGHSITVFEGDYIGRKIARQGLYEKENLEFLRGILERMKHAVVLDVGANIGNHTLAFATWAREVHAFEPLPETFALLRRNVETNGLHNVHLHPFALSDSNGRSILYRDLKGNIGASSFDRREGGGEEIPVEKRVGDEVVGELGLERLDLVKIDVEAHEVFVLQGLAATLDKFRPYIVMEWNDPLTIERLSGSEAMQRLFREYTVHVLGSRHDRGYWHGRPLAFLRRKLTRLFTRREAALYPFNPARLYRNLLLVPKGKERYLPEPHSPRHPAA